MKNNKKSSKNKSPKPNKKQNSHSNQSKSVITSIYTYSKKKSKRLGKTCVHFDVNKLTCNITKNFCKDADDCVSYVTNLKSIPNIRTSKPKHDNTIVGITTIVLNDNRKCTNNQHSIFDLNAIVRIVQTNGKILNYNIPAAYCEECDTYFILKKDYKIAKLNGKILCPIIDLTREGNQKSKRKNLSSSESRIHQLGYNVRRGSNFTKEQRQIILANIIENTNITKHEIESCITRTMTQHKNQPNYADAVLAWQQDLEFIKNYEIGDVPEVLITKVVVGKRT